MRSDTAVLDELFESLQVVADAVDPMAIGPPADLDASRIEELLEFIGTTVATALQRAERT